MAEYIPFGEQWQKEMMKWPKVALVEQLRIALIEKQELSDLVGEAAGIIAFNRMKRAAELEAVRAERDELKGLSKSTQHIE